jgi:hypothetical protein
MEFNGFIILLAPEVKKSNILLILISVSSTSKKRRPVAKLTPRNFSFGFFPENLYGFREPCVCPARRMYFRNDNRDFIQRRSGMFMHSKRNIFLEPDNFTFIFTGQVVM